MKGKDLLEDGYGRIPNFLQRSLKGLAQDDLNYQPKPDCNSIAWLVWHLSRLQDRSIARLANTEQLWLREGWHARFNRPADERDTGGGHTPEQVTAFKSPDIDTLLGYNHAVTEHTLGFIRTLSPADLSRELNEPRYQPLPTVGVRLVSVLADDLQHVGQIAYIRGLLQGKGWQKTT